MFETGGRGGGVGYGVKDVKSCWEEGDPADEHEGHGLKQSAGGEPGRD